MILDTCALLWLASDQGKLSTAAKETIGGNAGNLFVSAITAFEIAVKARSGKLELPMSPRAWSEGALAFHGVREIPIDSSIALGAVELPPLHNDPCDRLIVATALQHSMPIITCDRLIAQYENAEVIW